MCTAMVRPITIDTDNFLAVRRAWGLLDLVREREKGHYCYHFTRTDPFSSSRNT